MIYKQIKEDVKHINTRNQEYIAENNRMTKKIIDEIDVSGCKHYEDHTLYDCNETCEINGGIVCTKCKERPKCYYKQLKRKEQECEKLKNWVKNMMFDTNREDWFEHFVECFEKWKEDLFKQLDKLKAEKEEIKKYLGISSKTIMERLEELQEFRDNDKDKLYQAEQKLKSIKEIAKEISLPMGTGKSGNRVILAKQILQKISEVENDKN